MRKLGVVLSLVIALSALSLMPARAGNGDGLECRGQPVTIHSDIPGAVVRGTGGSDVILTDFDFAPQTIYAYGGNDLICSGYGDVVYGGSGADSIFAFEVAEVYGESGNDYLVVNGADFVSGGSGADTFYTVSVTFCDGGSGTDSFENNDCVDFSSIP